MPIEPKIVAINDSLATQAAALRDYMEGISTLLENINPPEGDARRVMLNNLCMPAGGAHVALNVLDNCRTLPPTSVRCLLGVLEDDHVKVAADDLLRSVRLNLIVETQFQIENGLRNVLRELTSNAPNKFYLVVQDLLTASGLDNVAGRRAVLMVPAHLRNCMHANGIHHGFNASDTDTVVDGVRYFFQHGVRVSCGSWGHIVHALRNSLTQVGEVLRSPRVLCLPRVEDAYAAQAHSGPD